MRTKITTGLVATNADGSPSIRPPVPASWCRPTAIPEAGSELDCVTGLPGSNGTSKFELPNMSSVVEDGNSSTGEGEQNSSESVSDMIASHESNSATSTITIAVASNNNNNDENFVTEEINGDESAPTISCETVNKLDDPSPVDLPDPSPANPNSNPSIPDSENAANSNSSTKLVSQRDLSEEVNADVSVEDIGDVDREIDVECNPGSTQSETGVYVQQDQQDMTIISLEEKMDCENVIDDGCNRANAGVSLEEESAAVANIISDEKLEDMQVASNKNMHQQIVKETPVIEMDALSMTIASVAAGEGEPPPYLFKEKTAQPRDGYSSNTPVTTAVKHSELKGFYIFLCLFCVFFFFLSFYFLLMCSPSYRLYLCSELCNSYNWWYFYNSTVVNFLYFSIIIIVITIIIVIIINNLFNIWKNKITS